MAVVKQHPVSGKVCILCRCSVVGSNTDQSMYILDLSSLDDDYVDDDGFVPTPPNIRFDIPWFGSHAFCALGSTLFVIEPAMDLRNPKNKSVYSFDLSSVEPSRFSNSVLDKTSLSPRGEMEYAKRLPRAIPTPDGKKILIFSTLLNYNHPNRGRMPVPLDHDVADEIDFELFDPLTNSFQVLPQIPHNFKRSSITVVMLIFIKESTFLLRTLEIGTFTLDLDDLNSGWKSGASFPYDVDVGPGYVIKDGFLFSPWGACEMNDDPSSEFSPFPDFSPVNDNILLSSSCITLLDHVDGVEKNEGDIDLCLVQAGVINNTWSPLMLVDVLSIDVNKHKEEKERGGRNVEIKARNVRSFKLCLGDQPCSMISTHTIFSLPRGT